VLSTPPVTTIPTLGKNFLCFFFHEPQKTWVHGKLGNLPHLFDVIVRRVGGYHRDNLAEKEKRMRQ
jgi:hypothetical protein